MCAKQKKHQILDKIFHLGIFRLKFKRTISEIEILNNFPIGSTFSKGSGTTFGSAL